MGKTNQGEEIDRLYLALPIISYLCRLATEFGYLLIFVFLFLASGARVNRVDCLFSASIIFMNLSSNMCTHDMHNVNFTASYLVSVGFVFALVVFRRYNAHGKYLMATFCTDFDC